jgi:hypothetical protein
MSRRSWIIALVGGVAALLLLCGGGAVWALFQLADQISAPGPSATGSGPCGSGDAVDVRLAFADGHVTQACTRDRPQCGNTNLGATGGHVFALNNQLRSDAGRYVFGIRFDVSLASDVSDEVAQVDPGMVLPKPDGSTSSDPLAPHALVSILSRTDGQSYNALAGTVTVSSQNGVVHGVIDAAFTNGPPRPDRPQSGPPQLVTLTGTFTCNA